MPAYTGVCAYGELYSVLRSCFLEAGWTVDDRTGQDAKYVLGMNAYQVWAVDSLYVYGSAVVSPGNPQLHGRVGRKQDGGISVSVYIEGTSKPVVLIAKIGTSCSFGSANYTASTNVTASDPYSFNTAQDTGIYFDDYYFIPTYSSLTMYYGGLFCASPAGVTVGLIKTPQGLLLRPASLVPPYSSSSIDNHWPVQYLLKVENTHVLIALQGIYQFDASALVAIGYTGLIKGDIGNPAGVAVVSTHQHPQQTQRAAVTNTVRDPNLPAYYIVWPATLLTSPNFDFDFMVSSLGLYRSDEGTRGTLYDVYSCNIQSGTLLNGETITASDGRKYTFFNVPTSQPFSPGGVDFNWYNGFHQNSGAWLVIRH